ncbi:MAG: hypothetical protein WEB53_07415 [Akkermansiaceae bacterium]
MNRHTASFLLLAWGAALMSAGGHDHFAAGICDTNNNNRPDAGEKLRLIGPDLSSRVFHLLARPTGFRPSQRCGGYYVLDESARTLFPNDAFSLTALSDGQEESGAVDHAHTGAYLWVEIVGVSGPAGASLGFWDEGRSRDYDTPSVSFATNEGAGNHAFVISGGRDDSGEDPHGHIHGRAWTADKPGDYHITFRLVDCSTSGPSGDPWHTPSEPFVFHFRAGPDFQPVGKFVPGSGYVLTWPSKMGIWEPYQTGIVFEIQRTSDPASGVWESIGKVTGTTADTATFTDSSPPSGAAFYRIARDWGGDKQSYE